MSSFFLLRLCVRPANNPPYISKLLRQLVQTLKYGSALIKCNFSFILYKYRACFELEGMSFATFLVWCCASIVKCFSLGLLLNLLAPASPRSSNGSRVNLQRQPFLLIVTLTLSLCPFLAGQDFSVGRGCFVIVPLWYRFWSHFFLSLRPVLVK